jgi:hypothetical protein
MIRQEAINYGTNGGSTWVAPFLSMVGAITIVDF